MTVLNNIKPDARALRRAIADSAALLHLPSVGFDFSTLTAAYEDIDPNVFEAMALLRFEFQYPSDRQTDELRALMKTLFKTILAIVIFSILNIYIYLLMQMILCLMSKIMHR